MSPHRWQTFLRSSLICRRGEICISTSGPVAREDLQALSDVLAIYLKGDRWPTVDELATFYECAADDPPHWHGQAERRIVIEGRGSIGCPVCGGATQPVTQGPK